VKIFGDLNSGNCLKVKYTADFLRLPYEWIAVDITRGEAKTPAFLAMNPAGQTPVVDFGAGRYLAQSNAIIRHIARNSPLLPDDAWSQAKIDEWLFWEQYSHEPYVAVCRFHMVYKGQPKETRDPLRVERGEAALDLMERHLGSSPCTLSGRPSEARARSFLVGETFTIADIALLAYTRVAHEGGFDLATRPNLRRWIGRCETALGLT